MRNKKDQQLIKKNLLNENRSIPYKYDIQSELKPIDLNSRERDLAKKLDEFYLNQPINVKIPPSKILEGALYAMRQECRSNPDWMSQSANSFRELLYPLLRHNSKIDNKNMFNLLYKYLSKKNKKLSSEDTTKFTKKLQIIKEHYRYFQNITHHGIDLEQEEYIGETAIDNFNKKVNEFIVNLYEVLTLQQLLFHEFVNILSKKKLIKKNVIKDTHLFLKLSNLEAKNYFFNKIDKRWLTPLWKNGLLDELKKQPKDTSKYSLNTPEIRYLARMAESKDKNIVDIVINIITDKSLATSVNKFNPELIDQILRILTNWKSEYISRTLDKLGKDRFKEWIKLMAPFGITIAFPLRDILKTLLEEKNYTRVLWLADCILAIKTKEDFVVEEIEIEKGIKLTKGEVTPFYLYDLEHVEVFEALQKLIESENFKIAEEVFALLSLKFKKILELAKPIKNEFFKYDDSYLLPMHSIYLFEIKNPTKSDLNYNTKAFFYTLKIAWNKLVKHYKNNNPQQLKKFFEDNIGYFDTKNKNGIKLSQSFWRFQLYALSQAPEVFTEELKKLIFLPLQKENGRYITVVLQSEYIKSMQIAFNKILSQNEQKHYMSLIRKRFLMDIKKRPKKKKFLLEIYGHFFYFTKNFPIFKHFKNQIQKDGFVIPKKDRLGPEIGPVITYTYSLEEYRKPKGNTTQYLKKPIDVFIKLLKTEWQIEKLAKINSSLKLSNIEWLIRQRVENEFTEMLQVAPEFFDRKRIHPHYLYTYLQAIKNYLTQNNKANFAPLFKLFKEIQESNKKHPFYAEDQQNKKTNKTIIMWIASWQSVHNAIAEILKEMLKPKENNKPTIDFKKYKDSILETLKYLLLEGYPDPNPQDDSPKGKKFKYDIRQKGTKAPNPFVIAINSIRGKAFEAFALYAFWDSRESLSNEIKKTMEKLVQKEKTRAMSFLYGYYTFRFYYRDKKWCKKELINALYKNKRKNKYLLLAAKEGYLSQSLYKDIFQDKAFQELYLQWIKNKTADYPNQEHFKHPDKGLADHLALAYLFLDIDIENKLFKEFWKYKNKSRWKEFIRFIGNILQSQNQLLKNDKSKKEKLIKLWQWLLQKIEDSDILSAFGHWIDKQIELIKPTEVGDLVAETIIKSKGKWENEFELIENLENIYSGLSSKEKFLSIIKAFFLPVENQEKKRRKMFMYYKDYRNKICTILKSIYKDKKLEVEILIDNLIREGGEPFWILEELLNNQ